MGVWQRIDEQGVHDAELAVVAPIPSASVTIAAAAKPGAGAGSAVLAQVLLGTFAFSSSRDRHLADIM
jgi:hypothetical protein